MNKPMTRKEWNDYVEKTWGTAIKSAYEDQAIEVVNEFKERLAQSIEQMPFGDTATSFAVYVSNFK